MSITALEIARENAALLGAGHVRFIVSDWYAQLAPMNFDMIISNPPILPVTTPPWQRRPAT